MVSSRPFSIGLRRGAWILLLLLAFVALSRGSVQARVLNPSVSVAHPVLAFYYPWYHPSDWCLCHMPDIPTVQYDSSDDDVISRQVHQAVNVGVTGFISSWWGPGDRTDTNFEKVLDHSSSLRFASTIYFESDAPALQGEDAKVNGLRYVISHYSGSNHFLHWRGKPVIFIWNPLGQGRTLTEWADIRRQVDPNHRVLWSAEGVNANLLDVFDGIHLFSAGYWGLLNGDMNTVDQEFRNLVDGYNRAHGTQKMWAAGVMPGYNDTRVPGRQNTFVVDRKNGATYRTSWQAAIASHPDMITITSFNEWYEGSMIEPSVTYHEQYLNITRQYAPGWHK